MTPAKVGRFSVFPFGQPRRRPNIGGCGRIWLPPTRSESKRFQTPALSSLPLLIPFSCIQARRHRVWSRAFIHEGFAFLTRKKKISKTNIHKFYSTYSPDVQKTATQYKLWQQETMLLQVCINQNQNIDVILFLFNKVPQGFRVLHRCKHYHVHINNMTTHNLSWLLSHRWDFENKNALRIFQ